MTEDIVQRLRSYHYEYPKICGEAADEIERLRKDNAATIERCAQVADEYGRKFEPGHEFDYCAQKIAFAIRALKDK